MQRAWHFTGLHAHDPLDLLLWFCLEKSDRHMTVFGQISRVDAEAFLSIVYSIAGLARMKWGQVKQGH